MNRQALIGVGIGLVFVMLIMSWVQFMVVPALRPEQQQAGRLPSDQLGAPAPVSDTETASTDTIPDTPSRAGSASEDEPRQSPALFDAKDSDAASNEAAETGGPAGSGDDAAAKAEADRVIERMQALTADGSADPEKMADLVGELRRNDSAHIAEEVDLAQMEQYLRQTARVEQFAKKVGQLEPAANPADRKRAMELSNKMLADMMTEPAFDNVEVPREVAMPQGGEAVGITPSIHLNPRDLRDTTDSGSP